MTTVTVLVTIPVRVEITDYTPGHPGDYGCRPEVAEAPYGSEMDFVIDSTVEELWESIYKYIDEGEVEDAYLEETAFDMDPDY